MGQVRGLHRSLVHCSHPPGSPQSRGRTIDHAAHTHSVRLQPGAPLAELDSVLVWFRRDLRTDDHASLSAALRASRRVHCAFVFDTEILDRLPRRADRRVEFIWRSVAELQAELSRLGGGLVVRHGRARDEIPRLAAELGVAAVFTNHDYEPQAIARDAAVAAALTARGIAFRTFKDQVIFEKGEVLTQDGRPFAVFTPYKNAWLKRLTPADLEPHPVTAHASRLAPTDGKASLPTLGDLGFAPTNLTDLPLPAGMSGAEVLLADFLGRIEDYQERRDFPALRGPSYLSVHLRFGTVSVRRLARLALDIGGRGAADVARRADLARFLLPDPLASPAGRRPRLPARVRRDRMAEPARAPGSLAGSAHRLSAGGCSDASDQHLGLHAQPPADGRGVVPGEGPARRLAARGAVFRRSPERLRSRREQRRLAVGGVDRLRCPALFPHLQPGDPVGALRPAGHVHPQISAGTREACPTVSCMRRGR